MMMVDMVSTVVIPAGGRQEEPLPRSSSVFKPNTTYNPLETLCKAQPHVRQRSLFKVPKYLCSVILF